jgi:hypothetical protein
MLREYITHRALVQNGMQNGICWHAKWPAKWHLLDLPLLATFQYTSLLRVKTKRTNAPNKHVSPPTYPKYAYTLTQIHLYTHIPTPK